MQNKLKLPHKRIQNLYHMQMIAPTLNRKNRISNSKAINLRRSLSEALSLFPRGFKSKIYLLTTFQSLLGILDLIGVLIFGLVGSITITTIQSVQPNPGITWIIRRLGMSNLTSQKQVVVLATLSIVLLILKSSYASYLQRYTMRFLSNSGADLTVALSKRMLNSTLDVVRKRSEKQSLFALTSGVEEMTLRVLGSTISIIADVFLIILLGVVLFISAPIMAATMLGIFTIFFVLIHKLVNNRARNIGGGLTRTTIKSNEVFALAYSAFKELVVRGQTNYVIDKMQISRLESAKYQAETALLPFISKYLMEAAVLIVGFALAAVSFLTSDASGAAGKLSLFFIASTRIAPALMRLQQGFYSLNMGMEPASQTVNFAKELRSNMDYEPARSSNPPIDTTIKLIDCTYKYADSDSTEVLARINLDIPEYAKIAIVGPSGSGKTTLANMILGLIEPNSGTVKIGSYTPRQFSSIFENNLGYVPQDPYISNDSIKNNITLGYTNELFTDSQIWNVINAVNLGELKEISGNDLNSIIGETGIKLSGGQKQKIAIARVALSNPRILVLDEATSSLDADSEFMISQMVDSIFKNSTIITIAHRLSTVINYPRILYMADGKIEAQGSFAELRKLIPEFDNQARKMGL